MITHKRINAGDTVSACGIGKNMTAHWAETTCKRCLKKRYTVDTVRYPESGHDGDWHWKRCSECGGRGKIGFDE